MEEVDIRTLLSAVTEIIKETGYKTLEEFPLLYVATTKEDSRLEAVLERFQAAPSNPRRRQELARELSSYIKLDDINMGLMALCASELKKKEQI